MDRALAEKGAKWWADQLRGTAKLDNGDPSPAGGMTMMLAMVLQADEHAARDMGKVDEFEKALADELEKFEDKWFCVGVDYEPDRLLSDVANHVGLPTGQVSFPWKTSMRFHQGKVTVACGYGASAVEI